MSKHTHKAISDRDTAYSHPVSNRENVAAHSNICRVEYCSCGAIRKTNINGRHVEQGHWIVSWIKKM
jgi:hypothetical protein